MILVVGTPDSGKSALAEEYAVKLSGGRTMAYIATMVPYGAEGISRIERHKRLRQGKDFVTFEEPLQVSNLIERLNEANLDTALLECVSNLVGNVMHEKNYINQSNESIVDAIVNDVTELANHISGLVVVANHFEKSQEYDEDTIRYIIINNAVNDRLKALATKMVIKEESEWVEYENN